MDSGEWQIYLLLYRNKLTTHDQPRGHMDPCDKSNGNKLTSHAAWHMLEVGNVFFLKSKTPNL